jgi:hypothetical protein
VTLGWKARNSGEEKMPMQKTDAKTGWKIVPVDEQNFSGLLKMMADYQRFYGVEEPDEEKNQRFFSHFIHHQDKGRQFLCFNGRGEAIGFSTLYYAFSSVRSVENVVLKLMIFMSSRIIEGEEWGEV